MQLPALNSRHFHAAPVWAADSTHMNGLYHTYECVLSHLMQLLALNSRHFHEQLQFGPQILIHTATEYLGACHDCLVEAVHGHPHFVQLCYIVLQNVAVCCSVLQCVAVCCSVLQCVAV